MRQYLRMDRQGPAKHFQWKATSIKIMIETSQLQLLNKMKTKE
jgi:hypothetical protein